MNKNISMELMKRKPLKEESSLDKRYLIKGILGQGGFGIIYFAMDLKENRKVAIKEYFPYGKSHRNNFTQEITFQDSEERRNNKESCYDLFLNEATILQNLSEFNEVVSYKDYFMENNTVYIVMEYFEGITLREWIQNSNKLKPIECFDLLKPFMNGMSMIHEKGIIHRDICPENILISEKLDLRIVDFGSALDLKRMNNKRILEPTYRKGFSPPEQYGEEDSLGVWSDIYAISATIYYCLTKTRPVDAKKRMECDASFDNELFVNVGCLKDVLKKGMSLKNVARYRTVNSLWADLTHNL